MLASEVLEWKRFWSPRDDEARGERVRERALPLDEQGLLRDPEAQIFRTEDQLRQLVDLLDIPCLLLLGEPGMGKSSALEQAFQAAESQQTSDTRPLLLDLRFDRIEFALRADPIYGGYQRGEHSLELFVDSLDESIDPEPATSLLGYLRRDLRPGLRLRLACRTGELPLALEPELRVLWQRMGAARTAVQRYELAPLREVDVLAAVQAHGVDEAQFMAELREANAGPLAARPVTLTKFLLPLFKQNGTFPRTRWNLYEEGCRFMCEDPSLTRIDRSRGGELSSAQRLAVASRLAAVSLLANRSEIARNMLSRVPGDIILEELEGGSEPVTDGVVEVTRNTVRDVLQHSALFTGRPAEHLGWGHRTFAEFLTAYFLLNRGLEDDDISSLIFPEKTSEIPFALRGIAAWLMSKRPRLFEALTAKDVSVTLRGDLGVLEDSQKAALVDGMLEQAHSRKFVDGDLSLRQIYQQLSHTGLSEQIRPWIRDQKMFIVARRIAFEIASACNLLSLADEILTVALDPTDELLVRPRAVRALHELGSSEHIARLKPLLSLPPEQDPQDDVLGNSLAALWPEHITVSELLGALRLNRDQSYFGAYDFFVSYELAPALADEDLPDALAWLAGRDEDMLSWQALEKFWATLVKRAWEVVDDREVATALARLAVTRCRRHAPFVPPRGTSREEETGTTVDTDARRIFLRAFVDVACGELTSAAYFLQKNGLLVAGDVEWLIGVLDQEREPAKRVIWIDVFQAMAALYSSDELLLDVMIGAAKLHPDLATKLRLYIGPVELGSPEADSLRHSWEYAQKAEQERTEYLSYRVEPPPEQRVMAALERAEAGALDAVVYLQRELSLRIDSRHYEVSAVDLTGYPGWQVAGAETRARIVEVSKKYLRNTEPSFVERLHADFGSEKALAGGRALYLILQEEPAWLGAGIQTSSRRQGPKFWSRWNPILLAEAARPSGEARRATMLRLAYHGHRENFLISLETLLVTAEYFDCNCLAEAWDSTLADRLRTLTENPLVSAQVLRSLIAMLVARRHPQLAELMRSLIPNPVPRDEIPRTRARSVAWSLLVTDPERTWPHLSSVFIADSAFGYEVATLVETMALSDAVEGWVDVSSDRLADIYIWLAGITEDQGKPRRRLARRHRSFDESMPLRWALAALRGRLVKRGSSDADDAFTKILHKWPDDDNVKFALHEARQVHAAVAWRPLQPREVLSLKPRWRTALLNVAAQRGLVAQVPVALESLIRTRMQFEDIARWRTRLTQYENAVCLIEINERASGTGFLVGPDLLLTAYHVVSAIFQRDDVSDVMKFRFDFKRSNDGSRLLKGFHVNAAANWRVAWAQPAPFEADRALPAGEVTMEQLDFALIRLERPVGNEPVDIGFTDLPRPRRGWIHLQADAAITPYDVNDISLILQHPDGDALQLAAGRILDRSPLRLRYDTNTLKGSSGSPCFNFPLDLVALHHSGDRMEQGASYNQGVPTHLIAKACVAQGVTLVAYE